MSKKYRFGLPALVLFQLVGLGNFPVLNAQPAPNATQERELLRAEAHLLAFRNDSASVIAIHLLQALKAHGQFDSPFGIRAQLAEAVAFEQDQRAELALKKLLRVKQQSREKGLPKLHAKACLAMALLYEKVGLKESSSEHLKLAKADVDRYGLDSLYPSYAIRMASWQRLYGDNQAALFFSREALRAAPKHGLIFEEAVGHMLMNMLLPESSVSERMRHSLAGVRLYHQLGDHTGCSYMFGAIASLYFQRNNFRQALAYNDSTLAAAHRAVAEGHERHETIAGNYQFRGEIYRQMGLLDSALANTERGYRMELALKEKDASNKVVEIEARYQNQQKQQQLEEQRLALRLKNNQLRFSFVTVLLVLASAVGLFIGYRKQRQAKQKLVEQNALIQEQAAQLRTLDAAKSRFFANVSHELRTPLTLLLGPVRTLLHEHQLTEKQTHLLHLAQRSGDQLNQLVTDLLDLGKLELGKLEVDARPTTLDAFFRHHLAQFESLAESRCVQYSAEVGLPDDAVANLDRAKCRQILNNLLSNAFKFTPSGERIAVSLTLADGCLHLVVADTGPGIHPDDLPHLFDRYFQTTRPDKPAEGGTGIGLALCQEYVHLMGGTIGVQSSPGTGSVFRVTIPVVLLPVGVFSAHHLPSVASESFPNHQPPGVPAPQAAEKLPVELDADRPTLLVVEDNPDLQAYIRLILGERYRLLIAANGQEALRRLQTAGPSGVALVLSDLMMPVMDGHQLLERLKADDATRHLPVVLLTARADAQDKLRALRIGVDDYLLKPFDEQELLAHIENLLTNQTARRQAMTSEPKAGSSLPIVSQADRAWLERFERHVRQHLADATLNVPELAEHFAMSESTLLRQLKRLTGLSPVQYVQAVRLEEARRLLESRSGRSIAQVAARVGYDDARSFARSFRARFGKLPSDLAEA
jgi:signal transduction histidine kinase/CheY-like chemotaxis protein/AraC-like DNA-binding protein